MNTSAPLSAPTSLSWHRERVPGKGLHRDHHGPPVTGHGDGNLLVLISFKVNTELKTVNNYFLLSLACADLIIGTFSMNLYTYDSFMGHWALGTLACAPLAGPGLCGQQRLGHEPAAHQLRSHFGDLALELPRPSAHPRRAALMIGLAWLVSFVLWAPAILFWQYLVGERTVLPGSATSSSSRSPSSPLARPWLPSTSRHGSCAPPLLAHLPGDREPGPELACPAGLGDAREGGGSSSSL